MRLDLGRLRRFFEIARPFEGEFEAVGSMG